MQKWNSRAPMRVYPHLDTFVLIEIFNNLMFPHVKLHFGEFPPKIRPPALSDYNRRIFFQRQMRRSALSSVDLKLKLNWAATPGSETKADSQGSPAWNCCVPAKS
jgi:hypothetical protein